MASKGGKFIDKKKAVTFSLVYRNDGDVTAEGVLVDARKGVGIGRVDAEARAQASVNAPTRRYPPGHPLAYLEDEMDDEERLTPAQRAEMIELGFPDDGYNYLSHLRVLGRGKASLEEVPAARAAPPASAAAQSDSAAPGTFVSSGRFAAPVPDAATFDASQLSVLRATEDEEEAAARMGGVSAHARPRLHVHGPLGAELEAVQATMSATEREAPVSGAEEAGVGPVCEGDLLDDFVLSATHAAEEGGEEWYSDGGGSSVDADEDWSEEEEEGGWVGRASARSEGGRSEGGRSEGGRSEGGRSEGGRSEGGRSEGGRSSASRKAPPKPGSIASTYWREEREDRRGELPQIDEQFEHLALDYDEEEIGDLEEFEPDRMQGLAEFVDVEDALDEFLEEKRRATEAKKSALAGEMERHGLEDEDADAAVEKALWAAERQAQEERADKPWSDFVEIRHLPEAEKWDCETVLSLVSNLDNHPGRIRSDAGPLRRRPALRRGAEGGAVKGPIVLSRGGFPMDAVKARGGAGGEDARLSDDASMDSGEEDSEEEAANLQRTKGEDPAAKKARKEAAKEAKRKARAVKRETKAAFKAEKLKVHKRMAAAQPQAVLRLPS